MESSLKLFTFLWAKADFFHKWTHPWHRVSGELSFQFQGIRKGVRCMRICTRNRMLHRHVGSRALQFPWSGPRICLLNPGDRSRAGCFLLKLGIVLLPLFYDDASSWLNHNIFSTSSRKISLVINKHSIYQWSYKEEPVKQLLQTLVSGENAFGFHFSY